MTPQRRKELERNLQATITVTVHPDFWELIERETDSEIEFINNRVSKIVAALHVLIDKTSDPELKTQANEAIRLLTFGREGHG